MKIPAFTHEELLAHIEYDPETGIFTRKIKTALRHEVGDRADYRHSLGYRVLAFNKSGALLAHRVAVFYMTGEWPTGKVDHRDGDPGNNRWDNLRPCTHQENMRNRRVRAGQKLKGAFLDPRRTSQEKPWFAQISVDGKSHYLGSFATEQEAHAAYKEAAEKIHGAFFCPG